MAYQTLYSYAYNILKDMEGGRVSNDSQYSIRQIMDKIRIGRAVAINKYLAEERLAAFDSNWLQVYIPTYTPALQDNASLYTIYEVPQVVVLPNNQGFKYVGKQDGITAYPQLSSENEVSNYNQHRTVRILNDKGNSALCTDRTVRILGNRNNRKIMVKGVFANPEEIPVYSYVPSSRTWTSRAFDIETDPYPISEALMPLINDYVKKELQLDLQQPVDNINDSADTREIKR